LLVVEDEEATQFVVAHFLEERGFEVVTASSASEARNVLTGNASVNAVFSDVRLPDDNGYTLAQCIRQQHPGLPIVLGSGGGLVRALIGQEFPFFLKPYNLCEVALYLHTMIRQSSSQRTNAA
jgi:two-component system response regulator HydG